jgi:hypothetical protein
MTTAVHVMEAPALCGIPTCPYTHGPCLSLFKPTDKPIPSVWRTNTAGYMCVWVNAQQHYFSPAFYTHMVKGHFALTAHVKAVRSRTQSHAAGASVVTGHPMCVGVFLHTPIIPGSSRAPYKARARFGARIVQSLRAARRIPLEVIAFAGRWAPTPAYIPSLLCWRGFSITGGASS